MLRNYILTALRNMKRYRVFTFINVAGLSIGLSICMLIIMTVSFQLESDRYNTKSDRIYRIITDRLNNPGIFSKYATVPLPMAEELKNNHTAVEQTVRIRRGFGNSWVGDLDDPTLPVAGFFADDGFLQLFEYKLKSGNPEQALKDPFSVVITEAAAKKIYGDENPLGQDLDMDEKGVYKVTGVIEDEGNTSHIVFEAVASMSSAYALEADSVLGRNLDSWGNTTVGWVYMALKEGSNPEDVEAYLETLNKEHFADDPKADFAFPLQKITDIKPGPIMGNEIGPFMPWLFVYILSGLGLIIMGSSCFNYINLTIARSMNRTREVGVRKVAGASRWQVFGQFIVESVIICLVALVLALVLLLLLEPAFAQLNFARILQWKLSHAWWVWGWIFGFTVFTGIVAGVFPALTLSSFQPIQIFRDMNRSKIFSRVFLRKFLLVSQFAISLIFIISIMILYQQVDMMMNAKLGFDNDRVLTIPYDDESFEIVKNELEANTLFESISLTSHMPASGTSYGETIKRNVADEDNGMNYFSGDSKYLETLGVELLAGRTLNPRSAEQIESEILINEAAVNELGFENATDAVGSLVYLSDTTSLTIAGVFPNYHHEALVLKIEPLAIRTLPDRYNFIQLRVAPGKNEEARALAAEVWKKYTPGKVVKARYLSEITAEFYDIMFGDLIKILLVMAVIASFVATLGLLGITIFTTELKVKEISIRKVMGAGDQQLFAYLGKGFIILVGTAILLAIPATWFLNSLWLEKMAFRIDMSPWYFIIGGGIMLLVSLVTVGTQVLRVIRINPAVSLRND
ncbi:ABC transporter permease [Fulvivirga sedimenti]|uniref:ABC transporter permease n=1 Tax=Fulvivirga sedimenti TaxID=2879465 RepID=A0A9X1HVP8_9BACT|nr:ABC transporter permease [Fulvivirga sedimenti]MCA6078741.1 ABC transporter permease [Fulvivirga sedimenti]